MALILGEILGPDMLIILAIVALLFGGKQLPKLARSLGSAKGEFEKGIREGEEAHAAAPPADEPPAAADQVTMTRGELDALIAERQAAATRKDDAPPAS